MIEIWTHIRIDKGAKEINNRTRNSENIFEQENERERGGGVKGRDREREERAEGQLMCYVMSNLICCSECWKISLQIMKP